MRVIDDLEGQGTVDQMPKSEGADMSIVLSPVGHDDDDNS